MTDELVLADADEIVSRLDWSVLGSSNVLVTGATGLVGSYVFAAFCHAQRTGRFHGELWGVSRSAVLPFALDLGRDAHLVQGDVAGTRALGLLPGFDLIVHAAGYGQPSKFTAAPMDAIRVNTTGTLQLLNLLNERGRFGFLSTSELYSGLVASAATEDSIGTTTPAHPRGAYIEAKRCGEAIMHAAHAQRAIQTVSFRLALAYGPGTRPDDGRVLNEIVRSALQRGRIDLKDSGGAIRTYCYVMDAVEMLLQVLSSPFSGTVNLGGVSTTTIRQLAGLVADLTGAELAVPHVGGQARTGAPAVVNLDLTLLKDLTGKSEFVSLSDGVARTIRWQREKLR